MQRKLFLETSMFINEEVSKRDKFRRKRIFLSLQLILCSSTKPNPSHSSFFNLSCVISLFPSFLQLPVKLQGICCTCLGVHRKKTGTDLIYKWASALLLMHISAWHIHPESSHLPRHTWGRLECRARPTDHSLWRAALLSC